MDQTFAQTYGGTAPENYQRYFVPSIAAPLADEFIRIAAPRPGEQVLDVACGTGVVTRLAAQRVGSGGSVAGLDLNPAMLAVARSVTSSGLGIEWHEGSADAMPLPDAAFDLVLCQMGLQFMSDKPGALRDMRRVLAPGGRVVLGLPGPTPPLFEALAAALGKHIGPQATAFVHVVFSLHDEATLRELTAAAGFRDVEVKRTRTTLLLPPVEEFVRQYVTSTPLMNLVSRTSEASRAALEQELGAGWRDAAVDGRMACDVQLSTVTGR
ncbi:methyltransferase domain-containing protein [Ramlibacter sp.]|uniref:methyltransferase domain-containing protein n=1 Tax=Ramlibacter sp. TaxID=1917967 RepID=UPI002D715C86|nr:methyltransferase domain-containing protein [Ramlibacter sp.]HYD74781.1 methyltransferase domain-containing protein [Ramlibacter sp.]